MGMKACSVETVGCQSIWTEMESAPVVMNTVHFCPRPDADSRRDGEKKGKTARKSEEKRRCEGNLPTKRGKEINDTGNEGNKGKGRLLHRV